jgi:hypothetical protein
MTASVKLKKITGREPQGARRQDELRYEVVVMGCVFAQRCSFGFANEKKLLDVVLAWRMDTTVKIVKSPVSMMATTVHVVPASQLFVCFPLPSTYFDWLA